ncbi:MAG TPA: hypothetical protein DCZ04_12840, partial [Syntrophorhabdus aromaticivorans]|nr:hypothetical protein [Syntrophorhabdus aromaticivorans]
MHSMGDDGYFQAGVELPEPRFTVNANATLTDNLTGLMWIPDGSVPAYGLCTGGVKTWQAALEYVSCLNTYAYRGYSDWRLPNRKELRSLMHYAQTNMATWLNAKGFLSMNAASYWSSTTQASAVDHAWAVDMVYGTMFRQTKSTGCYV